MTFYEINDAVLESVAVFGADGQPTTAVRGADGLDVLVRDAGTTNSRTVYDAPDGSPRAQPLTTVNGRIEGYVQGETPVDLTVNPGLSNQYIQRWTPPQKGDAGAPGPQGDPGLPGTSTAVSIKDFPLIAPEAHDTPRIARALAAAGDNGTVDLAGETLTLGSQLSPPSMRTIQGPGVLVVRGTDDGGPPFYPVYVAPGSHDITFRGFEFDGNKANIDGDPDGGTDAPACSFQVGGASALTPCHRINVEDVYLHDAFTMGFSYQNVEDSHVRARIEGNQRDGCTFYFNCRNIHVDLDVAECGDDHLGINSGSGTDSGLCENFTGSIRAHGPSPRNKGRALTIRGGKTIKLEVVAKNMSQSAVVLNDWPYVTGATVAPLEDVALDVQIDGTGGVSDRDGILIEKSAVSGGYIRDIRLTGQILRAAQDGIRVRNQMAVVSDDGVRDITWDGLIQGSADSGIVLETAGVTNFRVTRGSKIRNCAQWGFQNTAANKRIHVDGDFLFNGNGIKFRLVSGGSCRARVISNTAVGVNFFALSGFTDFAPIASANATDYQNDGGHLGFYPGPYRVMKNETLWDPPNVTSGASTSTTVTVSGAAVGDIATAAFGSAFMAGCLLTAIVTATDTVTVTLANLSGADKDFGSSPLKVRVEKWLP